MTSAPGPSFIVLISLGLMFLAPAVILLRRGFRPRRVGTTPYCAGCGYNLTGLSGERCPECGAAMIAGNVVHGEPYQRTGRIIAGFLCLALAAGAFVGSAYRVDWYQLRPSGWLISDLSSGSPIVSQRAWKELMRREQAGDLWDLSRAQLVDACLKEQGAATTGPLTHDMVNYLGQCLLRGALSPAQQETFFKQAVTLSLAVRPTVILGDPLPYEIRHSGRGPSENYWTRASTLKVSLGDQVVRSGDSGHSSWSGIGGAGAHGSSVKVTTVGRHTIHAQERITIHTGPFGDDGKSRLLKEMIFPLTAEVEVLPAASGDYVKKITEAGMEQALRHCLKPADFRYRPAPDPQLHGTIEIDKPPVSVAFKVFVRVNGREFEASSINKAQGESTHYGVSKTWWGQEKAEAPPPFTACDVILRGSEAVARRTVNLFEFWDGELVYKDVPVQVEYPTTQATSPVEDTE